MDIIKIRENLETLPDEIEKAQIEYEKADAQYDYLKRLKDHLLAVWAERHLGTNAERQRKATASTGYLTHLKGIHAAAEERGKKRAKYERLKNTFEAMRSLNKNV